MKHSAFTLNAEARLENSPFFRKHIRRGELVELLIKALLYVEVESHWNQSALSVGCKAGFSLLEPHVCSLTPSIPNTSASDTNQKPDGDAGSKRKSTSPTENGRNGKRARVEPEATQTEERMMHSIHATHILNCGYYSSDHQGNTRCYERSGGQINIPSALFKE
jgi:transducin (beta)-like 1